MIVMYIMILIVIIMVIVSAIHFFFIKLSMLNLIIISPFTPVLKSTIPSSEIFFIVPELVFPVQCKCNFLSSNSRSHQDVVFKSVQKVKLQRT